MANANNRQLADKIIARLLMGSFLLAVSVFFSDSAFAQTDSPQAAQGDLKPGQLRFRSQLLTVDANEGIDLADIDNDGKLDIVAGRNWYAAPHFAPRPLRSIEDWNGYVQSNGDFTMDVDGDGLIDVIAGSFIPTEVHWFRNPGAEGLKLGQLWQKGLLVDTGQSENEANLLHDLDGDGRPEWITNSWNPKNKLVAWQFAKRLTADPSSESNSSSAQSDASASAGDGVAEIPVQKRVIGVDGNSHGMGLGDINNDGREDILIATGWYERPAGDIWSAPWTFHADWELPHASIPILVCDMDRDGVNDLIWGKGHDYGLYWWQGDGVAEDGKLKFISHTIDDQYSQAHVLHFADLDGDGQDELIAGKRFRAHNGGDPGGTEMPCMYYYRWNAATKEFTRFVIDEGHIGTGLQIRTADLNDDGKVDIAVAGKGGTWILFNH